MEEKLGIENLIKIMDVVIEAGSIGGQIGALPKEAPVSTKLMPLLNIYDELFALSGVKFSLVIPELKDVDAAELVLLQEHFVQKFDIPQDKIEAYIEEGLLLTKNTVALVMSIVAFAKKIAAKE